LGLLAADLRHTFVRSLVLPLAEAAPERLSDVLAAFRKEARELLSAEGVEDGEMEFLPAADLRYRGQAYELSVPLPDRPLAGEDLQRLTEAFHQRHEALYGYAVPDEPVELVSLRLTAIGRTPKPELPRAPKDGSQEEARIEVRPVYFGPAAGWIETPILARERLPAGASFPGPAVVEGAESTVVVPPHAQAQVDPFGNLILEVGSWIP
jgi:N-methylhydantoinase A